jgi:hypothetical protein
MFKNLYLLTPNPTLKRMADDRILEKTGQNYARIRIMTLNCRTILLKPD